MPGSRSSPHKAIKFDTATFEPSLHAQATGLKKFTLNGPARRLLDHDRARPGSPAADEIADLDLHYVAPAQLAIYRQVKHCAVTRLLFAVESKSDRPYLLRLQCAFRALYPARVPRPAFDAGIIFRMSHDFSSTEHDRSETEFDVFRAIHGSWVGRKGGLR